MWERQRERERERICSLFHEGATVCTVGGLVSSGLGWLSSTRTSIPSVRPMRACCSVGNPPAVWHIHLVAKLRNGAGVTCLHDVHKDIFAFFVHIFLYFLLHAESPWYIAVISIWVLCKLEFFIAYREMWSYFAPERHDMNAFNCRGDKIHLLSTSPIGGKHSQIIFLPCTR